ncbi:hypothetical protein PPROV_000143100 [Pycnococcus provasolii]|uniref:Uncharacterized protein n=1 Tax=Pycnococcus provasolii TaxID=41880 RepID=A0A830H638_9CHLO|nr:hypothetical protein PPROV_000143100 [Pycnococcus provasolii]
MEQTREHAGARMAPAETSGAMYERTQAVKHAHRPFVRVSVPRCAAPTSCRLRQPHHWTASQPALRPGSANFAARMTRRVRRAESSENAAGQLKAGERYAAALAGGLDRDTVALRRLVEDARFADPGFDVAGSDAAEALRPLGPAVTTAKALGALYETQDFADEASATVSHALKRLGDMDQMHARVSDEVVVMGTLLAQRREQAAVLQAEMRARKQKLAEMQRRNRELRHVVACEANRYDWRPAVL